MDLKHQRCLCRGKIFAGFFNAAFFLLILISILAMSSPAQSQSIDQARSLLEKGNSLYSQGKLNEALEKFKECLSISEKMNYEEGMSAAINNIGLIYYSLGDYRNALDSYQRALKINEKTGNKTGIATSLANIGLIYYSTAEYRKALDYYQKSLKIEEETADKGGMGVTLINIGLAYYYLGDNRKALDYYQRALKIFEEAADKSSISLVFTNMGLLFDTLGDYQKALDYHQKALKIDEEMGNKAGVGRSLGNIGMIYNSFGEYDKALDYHQRALKIFEVSGDKSSIAKVLNNIGMAYYYQGDYQKALDYYQKSLIIDEELGDKSGVASEFGNIGVVYSNLGAYAKALDYFQKALKIDEEIEEKSGISNAFNNIGMVYGNLGDYQKALDNYSKSLKIEEEIGNINGKAMTLTNIGRIYDFLGEYGKALDFYHNALTILEKTGNRASTALTYNNMGIIYLIKGDYNKALDCYLKALKIGEEIGDMEELFRSQGGIGIAYKELKKDELAVENLSKAVKTLEEIRGKLKVEEQKTSFMQNKMIFYEELIELLIKKGRNEEAWSYTERAKARTFLDMLGNQKIDFKAGASRELINQEEELSQKITRTIAEAQKENNAERQEKLRRQLTELKKEYEDTLEKLKFRSPEYASLKAVEISSLKDVRKAMDKDTLLLEYFTGKKQSYLFIIDKDNLKVVEISENEGKLGERVSEILKRVVRRAPLKDEITSLSAILLAPAAGEMKGKKKLVIVPHSALHYLPFAMLTDFNGEYLAKNYQILTQPSASVWILCLNKKKAAGEKLEAFAIGDIAVSFGEKKESKKEVSLRGTMLLPPELMREGLSPLPGTEDEVKEISEVYPGGKTFVGNKATIEQVKASAGKGTLVHFATHGILDSQHPLFSGLVFYDGILTTSDIFGLNLNANLVVLSACNTAGGRISSGDEIAGMSRAFMYAGTPTVVASLWSISDVSTAQLMKDFYLRLKQGRSKAAALQEAQKDMMKSSEYSHPYYWAPFILIGDGGKE